MERGLQPPESSLQAFNSLTVKTTSLTGHLDGYSDFNGFLHSHQTLGLFRKINKHKSLNCQIF